MFIIIYQYCYSPSSSRRGGFGVGFSYTRHWRLDDYDYDDYDDDYDDDTFCVFSIQS